MRYVRMRHHGGVLLVLIVAALLFSCNKVPEPIKIGLSINLSGRGGAAGEHIRDGAMLAVHEINESGGINGRPLMLLVRDDENQEETIKQVDQALIDEGVVAIFGHSYSSNTLTAHPLVTSQDTLLVTAYSATNKLTGQDDLFLRTSVDCVLYGKKTATLLQQKDIESLAVLMDMSNASFVLDYVEQVKRFYPGKMITVSFNSKQHADWKQVIGDLLAPSPDAVLLLTEASMAGVAAQKLRNEEYRGPFIASVWVQTPSLFDYGGEAVEGMSVVTFINPENKKQAFLDFSRKLKEKFNRQATARSTRAYEMMMILADALQRCQKNINASELKKQILLKKYDTLMGQVAFDEFGDVVRPVYQVVVAGGRFRLGGEI